MGSIAILVSWWNMFKSKRPSAWRRAEGASVISASNISRGGEDDHHLETEGCGLFSSTAARCMMEEKHAKGEGDGGRLSSPNSARGREKRKPTGTCLCSRDAGTAATPPLLHMEGLPTERRKGRPRLSEDGKSTLRTWQWRAEGACPPAFLLGQITMAPDLGRRMQ